MAGYELGKLSDNVARFSQPLASLALELNIGNLFQTIPKHRYHKQKRRVNRFFDIREMLASPSPRSAAINVELVEINDSNKPAQNSLVMGHGNQLFGDNYLFPLATIKSTGLNSQSISL